MTLRIYLKYILIHAFHALTFLNITTQDWVLTFQKKFEKAVNHFPKNEIKAFDGNKSKVVLSLLNHMNIVKKFILR